MTYAVVFYLDPLLSLPIRHTIQELARKKIAPLLQGEGIQPHITLAIFDTLDCQTCETKVAGLAKRLKGVNLEFVSVGIFHTESPVVYLAPTVTQELLASHLELHTMLAGHATHAWELYLPGNWVPHCSLAMEFPPRKLQKAIPVCMQIKLPLSVPVAALGVVQFEPLQPVYDYAIEGK